MINLSVSKSTTVRNFRIRVTVVHAQEWRFNGHSGDGKHSLCESTMSTFVSQGLHVRTTYDTVSTYVFV